MWGNSFRIRPLGQKRGFPSFFLPFCRVRFHGSRNIYSSQQTHGVVGTLREAKTRKRKGLVDGVCEASEASNPRGCWCLLFSAALFGGRKMMMEESCASDFRNEWPEFLDKCTHRTSLVLVESKSENNKPWLGSLHIRAKGSFK